jgi:hypothetical protein
MSKGWYEVEIIPPKGDGSGGKSTCWGLHPNSRGEKRRERECVRGSDPGFPPPLGVYL